MPLACSAQLNHRLAAFGNVSNALVESKIIAPPTGGIYFGQYSWRPNGGDIPDVESAAGIKTAWFSPLRGQWGLGYVSGHPHLDVAVANHVWEQGRVILVQSYNLFAGTDSEHPTGFTVDQLLSGTYDSNLATFAAELRSFGKPCWMQCGREPNGVGQSYMGGFGTLGDQSLSWAITNGLAYNQFTPPSPPSGAASDIYSGCSGSSIPDGVGRLKAGQRYLYDYFVRRENLKFLTFDSQGWAARYWINSGTNRDVSDSADYVGHEAYALQVLQDANFTNFYPGDNYCDWVSLTFYTLDYYDASWTWLSGSDILIPTTDWLTSLAHTYAQVQGVTAKPILLAELGMPDGMNSNTSYGASKVTDTFNAILDTYTQIKGVSLWSNLLPADGGWFQADDFPYDCLIAPGTTQATALQAVIAAHPGKFHSAAYFTGNRKHPRA